MLFPRLSRLVIALVSCVCCGALLGLFAINCLCWSNARLRRENQELRAKMQTLSRQPASPAYVSPILVTISGTSNNAQFASTEQGGASGQIEMTGVEGTSMIYLGEGQTAQVTISGVDNTVHIAPALAGRVTCSDSGTSNRVTVEP